MKTYKCLQCGNKFSSDEHIERCPKCNSDNITPHKNLSFLHYILFFILAVVIGFIGMKVFNNFTENEEFYAEEENYDPIEETQVTKDVIILNTIPSIVSISPLEEKNGLYSFKVEAIVDSGDPLVYELYLSGDSELKYSSSDGVFTDIEPATATDGIYDIQVKNIKTGEMIMQPVSGFVDVKKVQPIVALSIEEIQSIFDNEQTPPSWMAKKFAQTYKMDFQGLFEDEPAPDRFQEIFNRLISGAWSSVKVIGLKYNELNQIVYMQIKVIE